MSTQNEKEGNKYPGIISYDCNKKIVEQMEKCICKIKINNKQGTGFFCKIPFPDKNKILPVLITNNHILDENELSENNVEIQLFIKAEEDIKRINLNKRMKYTNEEYDISIIEIKEKDERKNMGNFKKRRLTRREIVKNSKSIDIKDLSINTKTNEKYETGIKIII